MPFNFVFRQMRLRRNKIEYKNINLIALLIMFTMFGFFFVRSKSSFFTLDGYNQRSGNDSGT